MDAASIADNPRVMEDSMFPPQGPDPTAAKTILFVFVIAMLAHLCTMQLAHGEAFLAPAKSAATAALRSETSVTGDEIRLRDVARWSVDDQATLDPIGDLIVCRFGPGVGVRNLALGELKTLLKDAGVNLATIDFVGPLGCRVNRTDLVLPAAKKLDQAAAVEAGVAVPAAAEAVVTGGRTLRRALAEDLAGRLNLSADDIQLTFKPSDDTIVAHAEPAGGFILRPQRTGNLGDVSWVVTLDNQRVFLSGTAKAWRQQVVLNNAVPAHSAIESSDVTEKRQLVDNLPADALLTLDRTVGQAAARDLRPGQVVTTAMVTPLKLVSQGQDVTVDTRAGGVRLLTAARALSDGAMGQTVRMRNEATRETFNAVVIGPKRVSLAASGMAGSVR